ncbi:MAG TPA: BrnT family toxin [Thermoanaerobaculia bacterium]
MNIFDWDAEKERRNFRKHRVTFAEAQTVFDDPVAHIEDDPDHSVGEQRELVIGYSREWRLLVVSFVERGEILRIISARQVDARERKRYEEENS